MNVNFFIRAILILTVIPALISCSSDKKDAKRLLEEIPADALAISVIDAEEIIKKADLSKSDFKNLPSDGVKTSVFCIHADAENGYLSGLLSDPDKFRTAIENKMKAKMDTDGEISTLKSVAVSGDRFWISLGKNNISSSAIKELISLDRKDSFESSEYSDKLTECDEDIRFIINIEKLLDTMPFSTSTQIRMGLSMIWSGAKWIAGDAEGENGKMELTAQILDSDFKQAEYLLPEGKVDSGAFRYLKGGNILIAAAIPNALIKRFGSLASMSGMPSDWTNSIDGTFAMNLTSDDRMSATIETSSPDNAASLASSVRNLLGNKSGNEIYSDKNFVVINAGMPEGSVNMREAEKLDGCLFGVNIDTNGLNIPDKNLSKKLKSVLLRVKKESRGTELKWDFNLYSANNFWKEMAQEMLPAFSSDDTDSKTNDNDSL